MHKVIVFGSLNMDMSVQCRTVPRRGETEIGDKFLTTPGGKGGNQAVAAARMGADTFMVGKVGDDPEGRALVASLARHGVACTNVSVSETEQTGRAVVIRAEGDNRIVVDPAANASITYQEVRAAIHGLSGTGNIFLTQLEGDFETTMQSILCAKRNGFYTVLNASPARSIPAEVYKALDLLCVNESECELLTGIDPTNDEARENALWYFDAQGVKNAVITLGRRGSVALIDDKYVKIPTYRVDTVDTTGAGDAYLGELVAHLAFGGDLRESMVYASACAALCVGKVGSQAAMPTWDEVDSFVAEHGGLK
ncbi:MULTISPECIES: ribokinase [Atopobiaceae]|uniref:Ribokinase n=1 Tax=Parafannyhessea umbonata TaxID=604330 RepID=A0A1H6HV10_9ACTN|nr:MULTISPECIES: ribokinase [Atopobiaceae]SEH38921.1 ribokinase [Parafannyhessea umbonata]SJZ42369.1 ribokinase [Olsenella sp. KH1P3]